MEGRRDGIIFSRDPLDITKPRIITVDGYCIRDFQICTTAEPKRATVLAPYEENDDMVSCMEIDDNFDISITKSGKFVIQFHVASSFFGNIIGSRGSIRHKIEQETRTNIKIPRQGESGDIIITGGNERDVVTAKNRIDLVVWQARDKHPLTHFISIPMVSDMIKHNFDIFKKNLLTGPLIRGLHESMFQNPNKMHLTIATLVLVDEIEEDVAKKALKHCKEEIIKPIFDSLEPLRISMRGVEIMNDDPTNVDVLYGKVTVDPPKYNDNFQTMADGIVNYFAQKGLIRKEFESVKLHATLINSIFRKSDKQASAKIPEHKQKRESFDATRIVEKYKNYYFGEVNLNFIHLSVRFTTSENAYYEAFSTISVP